MNQHHPRPMFERLSKVSLHDHLDGGVRLGTLLELARELDVETPADNESRLAEWFSEKANSGSLVDYLMTFELSCNVLQTAEALERVAAEFVEDLVRDNVIYAEVRWAPEQHLRNGLSMQQAVDAVGAGLRRGSVAAARRNVLIHVNQILCAMRHLDQSFDVAALALANRGNGVVGFDIAGPEAGFAPARHRAAFDLLAENFFPVTIHAGEADGLDSIRSALTDGRAIRIGHGVRLAEDIRITRDGAHLGETAAWVRDRRIGLEVSPTSNLQTGATKPWGEGMSAHPFDLLYRLGFQVTVNVDNRTVSNTSLTRELERLADVFGYQLEDAVQFQINAAQASFAHRTVQDELIQRIRASVA